MSEPAKGMSVMDRDGRLGIVEGVTSAGSGQPARVIVQRDTGQSMVLQPGTYKIVGGAVFVDNSRYSATERQMEDIHRTQELEVPRRAQAIDVGDNQSTVIPVIREELNVTRREVERGGVRVHKRVEEREEVVEQPTFREEVSVERVTIGKPIDQEIGSRQEGDTLIIPVLEEMLVVEKRLVLKEELRITRRRVETTEQARVVLREEHVDLEDLSGSSTVA
jgi:uncharacterized protein (TIGR02271 family)